MEICFIELSFGRTSMNGVEHPGRQNEVTTKEMVNKIYDILLIECEIVKIVNIYK